MTDGPTPHSEPTPSAPSAAAVAALLRRRGVDAQPPAEGADTPLRGAAIHSDRVESGDLFVALQGERTHGLAFADAALERGAGALLSDRPHPRAILVPDAAAALLELGRAARAAWRAPVAGVSGSAGKTTAKAFLAAALDAWASPGNYNTPLALATTLLGGVWRGHAGRPLVLELGIDHVGEMARLTELTRPDAALLTLVAPSHLDGFGDVATVAREKGRLLEAARLRVASRQAAERVPPEARAGVVRYALAGPGEAAAGADVVGTLVASDPAAPLQVVTALGTELRLPHAGRPLAENALGALVLAARLGVPAARAAQRIAAARLEPGRLALRRWGAGLLVDDSYNSSPVAAFAALELLRSLPAPRSAVLGSMLELGPESERYHRELGAASRGLERVLAVGAEAAAILAGNPEAEHAPDAATARARLAGLPARGTLLVKGSRGVGLERLVAALLEDARDAGDRGNAEGAGDAGDAS